MNNLEELLYCIKTLFEETPLQVTLQRKQMPIVISALEKQISKIPNDTWENDIERRRHHLCRWACPNCGTFLGFENKHCIECGTKIKWDTIA